MDAENLQENQQEQQVNQQENQQDSQEFITDLAQEEKDRERERELEQKKAEERAQKRKLIPPFIMLLSGAITSITMYLWHYELKDMLIVLLCVLLVFYFTGEVIKWMFDRFEAQNEQARMDEGEVIEKEPDENGDTGETN